MNKQAKVRVSRCWLKTNNFHRKIHNNILKTIRTAKELGKHKDKDSKLVSRMIVARIKDHNLHLHILTTKETNLLKRSIIQTLEFRESIKVHWVTDKTISGKMIRKHRRIRLRIFTRIAAEMDRLIYKMYRIKGSPLDLNRIQISQTIR